MFLRLAGCNLLCPACDTDYTSKRQIMKFADIYTVMENIAIQRNTGNPYPIRIQLLVVTGGEPFRQLKRLKNFIQYVDNLVKNSCPSSTPRKGCVFSDHLFLQIETNGTVELSEESCEDIMNTDTITVRVVCSPKTAIVAYCYSSIFGCDWKYVMNSGNVGDDGLPTTHLGRKKPPFRPPWELPNYRIYLQPEDSGDPEQNAANLAACVESCMRNGYRLCVQVQKLAKLP